MKLLGMHYGECQAYGQTHIYVHPTIGISNSCADDIANVE